MDVPYLEIACIGAGGEICAVRAESDGLNIASEAFEDSDAFAGLRVPEGYEVPIFRSEYRVVGIEGERVGVTLAECLELFSEGNSRMRMRGPRLSLLVVIATNRLSGLKAKVWKSSSLNESRGFAASIWLTS